MNLTLNSSSHFSLDLLFFLDIPFSLANCCHFVKGLGFGITRERGNTYSGLGNFATTASSTRSTGSSQIPLINNCTLSLVKFFKYESAFDLYIDINISITNLNVTQCRVTKHVDGIKVTAGSSHPRHYNRMQVEFPDRYRVLQPWIRLRHNNCTRIEQVFAECTPIHAYISKHLVDWRHF